MSVSVYWRPWRWWGWPRWGVRHGPCVGDVTISLGLFAIFRRR